MTLGDMERMAKVYRHLPEIQYLASIEQDYWGNAMEDLLWASERDGVFLNAGEGNILVETRKPYVQTADYASVTQTTTSKNWLPQRGTGMMFGESYWDVGKEWRFTLFGKMTTGATPGNHTTEIRHQNAVPLTDAGGTILATSSAVAAAANKTNISFLLFGRIHSRSQPGATASLFAHAMFISNQLAVILPAANIPQLIPESAPASVAVDSQAAGGISIQGKNSGANASTVVIHDLSVEAMT
jgi:hypothetical protein